MGHHQELIATSIVLSLMGANPAARGLGEPCQLCQAQLLGCLAQC